MFYFNGRSKKPIENRFEAISDPEICYLYFYDKEFSKVDWTIEPTKSLPELYRERAEQIRSKYEYLILAYSGGHDSSQVLETFYYNNIHIDEILMVGAFSQDLFEGSDDNHNGEIYHTALPLINKLHLPNTKISVVDYTKHFVDIDNFTLIHNYGSDWVKHVGSFYSVHNLFWRDLKKFIGRDNDKNTGVIFGGERPNFQFDASIGIGYTEFSDLGLASYGNFQKDENFEKVNFYTALETVELMKKQLHLIQTFFIRTVIVEKQISIETFVRNYDTIIHKLIYFLKNPIIFKSYKSRTNLLSYRDYYLINGLNSTTDIYKIYTDGISKMTDISTLLHYKGARQFVPSTAFFTRRYPLCTPLVNI